MANTSHLGTSRSDNAHSPSKKASSNNKGLINVIEPWVKQFITQHGLKVLRNKRTRRALNVSYTEDGLRWTIDRNNKLIFYKNAYLKHKMVDGVMQWYITGNTEERNPHLVVEDFIPENHFRSNNRLHKGNQLSEYRWVDKALRMLYHVDDDPLTVQGNHNTDDNNEGESSEGMEDV